MQRRPTQFTLGDSCVLSELSDRDVGAAAPGSHPPTRLRGPAISRTMRCSTCSEKNGDLTFLVTDIGREPSYYQKPNKPIDTRYLCGTIGAMPEQNPTITARTTLQALSPADESLLLDLTDAAVDPDTLAALRGLNRIDIARFLARPEVQAHIAALRSFHAFRREIQTDTISRETAQMLLDIARRTEDLVERRRAACAVLRALHALHAPHRHPRKHTDHRASGAPATPPRLTGCDGSDAALGLRTAQAAAAPSSLGGATARPPRSASSAQTPPCGLPVSVPALQFPADERGPAPDLPRAPRGRAGEPAALSRRRAPTRAAHLAQSAGVPAASGSRVKMFSDTG